MSMEGLGRLFDLSVGVVPVDLSGGAKTGFRQSLKSATGVTVVVIKGAGSTAVDPVLTINSYQASSGGSPDTTSVTVDHYWKKEAASYAGTVTWTKVAQSASNVVTLTGESDHAGLYAFFLPATALASGYQYISVDTADAGSVAQIGGVFYLVHDLVKQRSADRLDAQLT